MRKPWRETHAPTHPDPPSSPAPEDPLISTLLATLAVQTADSVRVEVGLRGATLRPSLAAAIVAAWTLAPGSLHAQDPIPADTASLVTLIGKVRDRTTDAPIRNAVVKILELDRVEWTDPNGFFRFDDLPQGTWTFEATALAYGTNTEASTIGEGNILLIRLEPAPHRVGGPLRRGPEHPQGASHADARPGHGLGPG